MFTTLLEFIFGHLFQKGEPDAPQIQSWVAHAIVVGMGIASSVVGYNVGSPKWLVMLPLFVTPVATVIVHWIYSHYAHKSYVAKLPWVASQHILTSQGGLTATAQGLVAPQGLAGYQAPPGVPPNPPSEHNPPPERL